MDPVNVKITFDPALHNRFPDLKGWNASFSSKLPANVVPSIQAGDWLKVEGAPVGVPLRVLMRLWTVMSDQAELELVLHLPPAAAA